MANDEITTTERGPSPRLILVIVLVVLGFVFIAQNTASARFNFLFWKIDAPAWLWFIALLAIGFVAGLAFSKVRARRNPDQAG
jgi:uncharacterized integral membrane protein